MQCRECPLATPYHGQVRAIVRAKSRAAVLRAVLAAGLYDSASHIRTHWSITGNADELATVAGTEGVVFLNSGMRGQYQAMRWPDRGLL